METADLQTLLLVAKTGSFAAAARARDMDPSSISRTVANAERALGFRVFQRTTRSLSPTEEGERYLRRLAPLLEELERAADEAQGAAAAPAGPVRLTASVAFAHTCIVPLLPAFHDRFPKIAVELLPTDDTLDLHRGGIDLAIRLGPAPEGDLISTRLRSTRYAVVAAPDYVATEGAPATPPDLTRHNCLRFALPDYRTRWLFRRPESAPFDVPIGGRLVIANALSLRQAALAGLGPALLPDWLVGEDLAAGRLIDLFPDYACTATTFDTGAWALYPSRRYLPARVRVTLDFLRAELGAL